MARETLPVALKLMFGHEGGYVNVASDRGGPTKYGITHRTLAAHRGKASVTADQVRAMLAGRRSRPVVLHAADFVLSGLYFAAIRYCASCH